ncbi:GPR1/FUN34/YaaH family transporter [Streptomyces sp. NPDC059255]|uniref:GPR1/FUN34/YaaH family transporter n=1 Tax=Streptomyces sp. NPDC059255 TaxID=3346793 RepID=UPI00369C4A30
MSQRLAETTTTAPAATVPAGNPLIAGLPGFVVGSIALALQLTGFVPADAASAVLPITFGASAISTLMATIWATRAGQNAVACIFVAFTGFWVSYTLLVMGLTHNWLAIPADHIVRAQTLFLLCWLFVIGTLTLGALRLPLAFTVTLLLVDLCILFNIIGAQGGRDWANTLAGACAFGFALIGAYLLVGAVQEEGGGKPYPLGRPVLSA